MCSFTESSGWAIIAAARGWPLDGVKASELDKKIGYGKGILIQ